MDTKKILIIVGIVISVGGYFIWKAKKEKDENSDPLGLGSSPNMQDEKLTDEQLLARVKNDNSFPLRMGSHGDRVRQLQEYVKGLGGEFNKHGVDGVWGAETEQEVFKYLSTNVVTKDFFIKKEIYLL